MRGAHPSIAGCAALAMAVLGATAGCARPTNPWVYAEPPAVKLTAAARPVQSGRTVVAVARFANPDVPQLDWPTVGAEMSSALRRSLYNETDFEVRIAPEIERAVSDPAFLDRDSGGGGPVEVDFVVIGKVTDFHHTAGLPKGASRWGIFVRRHEAVVAIEWKVVDVRARRIVATDHTYGTAKASREKSIQEQYAGLDMSAYLFWNTPLGRAAHAAIDDTIEHIKALLPGEIGGRPTIVEILGPRKVALQGGWQWGLADGDQYYLVARDRGDARPRTLYDAETGKPLQVTLSDVHKGNAVGWVLGKPPEGVDLRGASLSGEAGPPPEDLQRRGAVAGLGGDGS